MDDILDNFDNDNQNNSDPTVRYVIKHKDLKEIEPLLKTNKIEYTVQEKISPDPKNPLHDNTFFIICSRDHRSQINKILDDFSKKKGTDPHEDLKNNGSCLGMIVFAIALFTMLFLAVNYWLSLGFF